MVHFTSFVLSAWVAQVVSAKSSMRSTGLTTSRELSLEKIAGYAPNSKVTDHNALDLDQAAMETYLKEGGGTDSGYAKAKKIYTEGGHSKSVADIILPSPGLIKAIEKKDVVIATGRNGDEVRGTAYKDYAKGSLSVRVTYNTSEDQATSVMCKVGGLQVEDQTTTGCLNTDKKITIDGDDYASFTHDYLADNKNGRTIQGFSTAVEGKMITCDPGCPFADAAMFKEYYGKPDYADHWVLAAFGKQTTNFSNGNADFTQFDFVGRTEAIKKGTVTMHVFMYTIREFEDAVVDCRTECDIDVCNDAPVHAWDEGVAFYTGSLEGKTGDNGGDTGKLLHNLADKRCANFDTCDENGLAQVNSELFKLFDQGQAQLLANQCGEAKKTLRKITPLMYVPLIQGTLRYAYKVEQGAGEKEQAEGVVFAAAVLPRVHNANEADAATIYSNMKIGASATTSFAAVKSALENNYEAMGIDCAWVGGLTATTDPVTYVEGGTPCTNKVTKSTSGGTKLGFMAAALGSVVVAFSIL